VKVKVRGIYTTALTKILTENGFELANPSKIINERFNITENKEPADTLVYDKEDLNGITISGTYAEKIVELLNKNFFDISVRKNETGMIYCGKIKRIETKYKKIWMDLGNGEEGILSLQNYWGFLRDGEKVLVQVKNSIRGLKILSTQLRIFGENMILIKDGFTKVSDYISSKKERDRLRKLSSSVKLEGWGVLWKSLAEGKSDEELISELNSLVAQESEIKESFGQMTDPGVVKEGLKVYFVDFGSMAKQALDQIRKNVITTVVGHHFLKAGGYTILTDFAESLDGIDNDIVKRKINKVLQNEGPQPGQRYRIIHKKPGTKDVVFNGIIKEVGDSITVKRLLHSGGRLDGIGGSIDEGDYAITTFKPGSWKTTHKYFNKDGYPKGVYININTPIEVYPSFARNIDLEVDVVEKDDKREIVDVEKLEMVRSAGIIKSELADKALQIANEILKGESDER